MATLALQPLRHFKSASGGAAEMDSLSVSGTIINGDVCDKANGVVAVCSNEPTTVSYVAVSAGTDTVPGATTVPFVKINPADTFICSAHHSTAASAVVPDSVLDQAPTYGLIKQTVSSVVAWCVDLSDTTNTCVKIVDRQSSATDVYPRVMVQFIGSKTLFN